MLDYFQLVELLSDPGTVLSFSGQLNPMNFYVAGSWMFWVALLIAVPALTMRLIAEERRTGTIEGLMTVPVTEGRLDLGPWQQIFYAEFDGRRRKRVIVKVIGE